MGDDNDKEKEAEKKFKDMLGLVKFCLESTKSEDASAESAVKSIEPERRAWLENALKSMSIDVVGKIVENLKTVKQAVVELEAKRDLNIDTEAKADIALDELNDICEEIDYANDFAKLNGISIFCPLLESRHAGLKKKACDLIVALAQNNPSCQRALVQAGALDVLIKHLNTADNSMELKAKIIYAISAILRSNDTSIEEFNSYDLFVQFLENTLQLQRPDKPLLSDSELVWWRKCCIKLAFLTGALVSESQVARERLAKLDILPKFCVFLRATNDVEVRGQIIACLLSYLRAEELTVMEFLKPRQSLEQCVKEVMSSLDKEDQSCYEVEKSRDDCEEILKLLQWSS